MVVSLLRIKPSVAFLALPVLGHGGLCWSYLHFDLRIHGKSRTADLLSFCWFIYTGLGGSYSTRQVRGTCGKTKPPVKFGWKPQQNIVFTSYENMTERADYERRRGIWWSDRTRWPPRTPTYQENLTLTTRHNKFSFFSMIATRIDHTKQETMMTDWITFHVCYKLGVPLVIHLFLFDVES